LDLVFKGLQIFQVAEDPVRQYLGRSARALDRRSDLRCGTCCRRSGCGSRREPTARPGSCRPLSSVEQVWFSEAPGFQLRPCRRPGVPALRWQHWGRLL